MTTLSEFSIVPTECFKRPIINDWARSCKGPLCVVLLVYKCTEAHNLVLFRGSWAYWYGLKDSVWDIKTSEPPGLKMWPSGLALRIQLLKETCCGHGFYQSLATTCPSDLIWAHLLGVTDLDVTMGLASILVIWMFTGVALGKKRYDPTPLPTSSIWTKQCHSRFSKIPSADLMASFR